jgi:ribosome biogenesis protein BRX1
MSSAFKHLKKRNNQARLHEVNEALAHEGKTREDLDNPALIKRIKTGEEALADNSGEDSQPEDRIEKQSVAASSENDEDLGKESDEEEKQGAQTGEAPALPDFRDSLRAFKDADPASKEWKNRQRVLIVTQRGIGGKYRELLTDLINLIPHSKLEAKVDRKNAGEEINQICYERSCNNFIYFESRNHKVTDLFLWLAKSPSGPSFKFALSNIHGMKEMKMTGNCLQYSRPFLSFDGSFEDPKQPQLQLCKELLSHMFNTPKNHPKSKPFIDHVLSFNYHDGKIWFRNYQVLNSEEKMFKHSDEIDKLVLVEIGPRFALTPIKAFEGSLGGEPLYQNGRYIGATKLRSKKYETFRKRREEKELAKHYKELVLDEGEDPDAYLDEAFEDSAEGSQRAEEQSEE